MQWIQKKPSQDEPEFVEMGEGQLLLDRLVGKFL